MRNTTNTERFEEFFHRVEPQLRRALVTYGVERGREAFAVCLGTLAEDAEGKEPDWVPLSGRPEQESSASLRGSPSIHSLNDSDELSLEWRSPGLQGPWHEAIKGVAVPIRIVVEDGRGAAEILTSRVTGTAWTAI